VIVTNTFNHNPRHLMIYLGNNQVLHNRFNSYSTVEMYYDTYKNLTSYILRHRSLC
jgi:hypothetical protein